MGLKGIAHVHFLMKTFSQPHQKSLPGLGQCRTLLPGVCCGDRDAQGVREYLEDMVKGWHTNRSPGEHRTERGRLERWGLLARLRPLHPSTPGPSGGPGPDLAPAAHSSPARSGLTSPTGTPAPPAHTNRKLICIA